MRIEVSIRDQIARLFDDQNVLVRVFPVSTAARGVGEQNGSFCTPRGRHLIRAKIGTGAPDRAVFVNRRPTGEVHTPELAAGAPKRDWILTRILWLSGCQPEFNRLGNVDTMRRFIYLHGTPHEGEIGSPGSHGCVRMGNRDIRELFDLVPVGTPVDIQAD